MLISAFFLNPNTKYKLFAFVNKGKLGSGQIIMKLSECKSLGKDANVEVDQLDADQIVIARDELEQNRINAIMETKVNELVFMDNLFVSIFYI